MSRRTLRVLLMAGAAALTAWAGLVGSTDPGGAGTGLPAPRVLVTPVVGPITPITADHLADVLHTAAEEGYDVVVFEIDTPGGLVSSMRSIVTDVLESDVPVVAYVTPRGGRAASAGSMIALATHVAAMAPGTTIGAATPVDLEGGEVGDKVVEDAAAYAEALAELRDRNVEFAIDSVRTGRAISANTAVEIGVVELIAGSRSTLLDALDGREVRVQGDRTVVLRTADASVDVADLSVSRQILQVLVDPNVAFILLSVGTLALIYELASPGGGVAGVLGVIMLALALVSFAVVPVDALGLMFVAVAAGCFVAELYAPGVGVFAFLGAGALAMGAVVMFRDEPPELSVSLAAVLPTVVVVGAAVVIAGQLALRSRRRSSAVGASHLEGQEVVVAHGEGARGDAQVEGAWWQLRSAGAPLAPGRVVRIVRVEGLDLVVEPVEEKELR